MILKLAWRNIWRNRRRTWITVASILFAVLLSSLMEALQKGAWNHMIGNMVNYYTGYAQVHGRGYWEEQVIDNSFSLEGFRADMGDQEIPQLSGYLPRLESFALASTGNKTSGVLIAGVVPDAEDKMSDVSSRIVRGTFFEEDSEAVLIGEGLAEHLNLEVQDTLILISQGYQGVNAAGKYPVSGIVRFGSPELSKQMVYMPLAAAQWFFGAADRVTSVALDITAQKRIPGVVAALESRLDTINYEVMSWEEMLPELLEAKAMDSAGNYVVYFILYMVITFGILGTILMMLKEREYEFGILVAIGMHKLQLTLVTWVEIILMGLTGSLMGILAAFPVVWYFRVFPLRFTGDMAEMLEKFGFEPIFPAELNVGIFVWQAAIVLSITALLAVFPWLKIRKLKVVAAMKRH